jgi:uncharacterized protein (DUF433 family)
MAKVSDVISAFTEDQAERLTGVSQRQLRYWNSTGFFAPSLMVGHPIHASGRLYSFRDLASLRVINALRNEARVPLKQLRDVKEKLAHIGDDLWAKTTLYVLNRNVILHNPEKDSREEVVSGQAVFNIELKAVSGSIEEAVRALRQRDASLIGKVERQRNVLHNQPVIAGTRVPVSSVQAFAKAGYSLEEIQKEYPTLTAEDIQVAIGYEPKAA